MRRSERVQRVVVVLVACLLFMGVELLLAQQPSTNDGPSTTPVETVAVQASEEAPEPELDRPDAPKVRDTYDLTPSQERLLRAALDDFQMADVRSIGLVLAQTASLEGVQSRWEELVRESRPHAANLPLLVRAVMREAFHEVNREVQVYTEKMLFYNDMTGSISREIERIEGERSLAPDGKGEWDAYHEKLRGWLASTEDEAELASQDLQSALAKQEQTLVSLASLSLALHDAGMAVIR